MKIEPLNQFTADITDANIAHNQVPFCIILNPKNGFPLMMPNWMTHRFHVETGRKSNYVITP